MTPPTLRDALDSLALEWETEAARRTNDAKTRKGQERKALNVGAEFERHHAAMIAATSENPTLLRAILRLVNKAKRSGKAAARPPEGKEPTT